MGRTCACVILTVGWHICGMSKKSDDRQLTKYLRCHDSHVPKGLNLAVVKKHRGRHDVNSLAILIVPCIWISVSVSMTPHRETARPSRGYVNHVTRPSVISRQNDSAVGSRQAFSSLVRSRALSLLITWRDWVWQSWSHVDSSRRVDNCWVKSGNKCRTRANSSQRKENCQIKSRQLFRAHHELSTSRQLTGLGDIQVPHSNWLWK